MDQSFPSLTDDAQLAEESFWPSFTDILTVIVLIFLMAMLVLLLRNMDLLSALQQSIAQKEAVFAQSEQLKQHNIELQQRLRQQQASLQQARERYQQATASLEQLTQLAEQRAGQLRKLQASVLQLQQQLEMQQQRLQTQQSELQRREALQQRLEADYQQLTARLGEARASLARQQNLLAAREREIQSMKEAAALQQREQARMTDLLQANVDQWRAKAEAQGSKLMQMQDAYSMLQQRYLRLIRPARSPRNKHVVEVLYTMRQGTAVYGLRQDSASSWQIMPLAQLRQSLQALKDRYGKKLYVRIIIPDDSPLSFNQAWEFTHRMLKAYDYYYQ